MGIRLNVRSVLGLGFHPTSRRARRCSTVRVASRSSAQYIPPGYAWRPQRHELIGIIHDGTQFHRAGIKAGASGFVPATRCRRIIGPSPNQADGDARSRRVGITTFVSAATSNASIATSQAVVFCSDLERAKIYSLASSSVCRILPSGKTTGRSKRLFQDTDATPQIKKSMSRKSLLPLPSRVIILDF
jgi:hypothetical protein